MTFEKPQLWVDFDGTAVTGLDLRQRLRLPVRVMPGFGDFLQGVGRVQTESDDPEPQIDIAGILTMRPRIFMALTALEVRKYNLKSHFASTSQLVHAGSERAKAEFLVKRSEGANVGMIEDGPHRLGPRILDAMSARQNLGSVLLGVVEHDRSQLYTDKFLDWSRRNYRDLAVEEFDYGEGGDTASAGYRIRVGRAALDVVQLAHYSGAEGENFARRLIKGAS